MKAQIELESVKKELVVIKTVMAINGKPNKNIQQVILEAVKIASTAIISLDEESLEQVLNLKKSM
jgi:hypothetical protein